MKDLHDIHLAEVHEAQSEFNRGLERLQETYTAAIHASRERLYRESIRRFGMMMEGPAVDAAGEKLEVELKKALAGEARKTQTFEALDRENVEPPQE